MVQGGVVVWLLFKALRLDFMTIPRLAEFTPDLASWRDIARQSLPTSASMMLVAIGSLIIVAFVARFGESALAAYGIALRIEQLILLPTIGINIAVLSMTGVNLGAGNHERVREIYRTGVIMALVLMTIGALVLAVFADQVMGLFTDDEEVRGIGRVYLYFEAVILPAYALTFLSAADAAGAQAPRDLAVVQHRPSGDRAARPVLARRGGARSRHHRHLVVGARDQLGDGDRHRRRRAPAAREGRRGARRETRRAAHARSRPRSGARRMNLRHLAFVAALSPLVSTLGGCAALVTPNYSTDLAELRSGDYTLDPDHAYLLFRVEHLGLSMVVGRFDTVDATLDFAPDDLAALRLDGVVDVASIDLDDEDLERRLRGSDWLDAAAFPEARFTTTEVVPGEDGAFVVTGDFTLRGTTLPLALDARFNGGADNILTGRYTLGFAASGTLSRSAYGIDSLGALVGDEIGIEIHAEFQREP